MDELLAMVSDGVVCGMTLLSFGVTWRQKVSGGIGCFTTVCHSFRYKPQTVVERLGHFTQHLHPQTTLLCSVMDTLNLGKNEAFLKVFLLYREYSGT